jgi:tRNA (guanine37-N1)-methyltransferase
MTINIITLFPGMFNGIFEESILKRAISKDLASINLIDLRKFGEGPHRVVDDTPYGGGGGMVIKPGPIADALSSCPEKGHVILTTPRGTLFTQADALRLSHMDTITIICGHYEGIDERVTELFVDEELSIGDYVLTGGEIPAMTITDAVIRLIPGVLGMDTTVTGDSHYDGLLEHPHYTRPPEFMGIKVPEVLLSGDHANIRLYRRKMALLKTKHQRPDLFNSHIFNKTDRKLSEEE